MKCHNLQGWRTTNWIYFYCGPVERNVRGRCTGLRGCPSGWCRTVRRVLPICNVTGADPRASLTWTSLPPRPRPFVHPCTSRRKALLHLEALPLVRCDQLSQQDIAEMMMSRMANPFPVLMWIANNESKFLFSKTLYKTNFIQNISRQLLSKAETTSLFS